MPRVSQPGRLIRDRGAEWAHTTLPAIQLYLAQKRIVRRNSHLCPSLQHSSAHSFCPLRLWGAVGPGVMGVRYAEGLPGKVEVDAKALLDCVTHPSASRVERPGAMGAFLPTPNPLPKASSSSIPPHTLRNRRALAPPCQIRDVKRARRGLCQQLAQPGRPSEMATGGNLMGTKHGIQ
jgi:hypothetical protein